MINVEYANETKEKIIELSEIKKLVKYAVKYMKLDNVEFGIIFVNNKFILSHLSLNSLNSPNFE